VSPVAEALVDDQPDRGPRVSGAAGSVVVAPGSRAGRRVAASGISARQNLASLAVALVLVVCVVLVAGAVALLIATTFYGYGGLR
jgi:hypothetical protein